MTNTINQDCHESTKQILAHDKTDSKVCLESINANSTRHSKSSCHVLRSEKSINRESNADSTRHSETLAEESINKSTNIESLNAESKRYFATAKS